jgi:dimethylsulfone monooxygenase
MKERRFDDDSLRLGLFWPTTPTMHITSRAVADANPDIRDLSVHRQLVEMVERMGLDWAFVADRWVPYGEASTRAHQQDPMLDAHIVGGMLLGWTSRLGVITTLHVPHYQPAHIARFGATLDAASGGRWGWNIVTGFTAHEFALFGREHVDHDRLYEMADEMLQIVLAIWGADAPVEFDGRFYSTSGKLVGPRPVQQPYPLLVNAGSSAAGRHFAARYADYIFIGGTPESIRERLGDACATAERFGRPPGAVLPVALFGALVRDSHAEAEAVRRWVSETIDAEASTDFSSAITRGLWGNTRPWARSGDQAVAAPSPPAPSAEANRMLTQGMYRFDTAEAIAEAMIAQHREGIRALNIVCALWSPAEVARLEPVLAILKRAGVWRPAWERDWHW